MLWAGGAMGREITLVPKKIRADLILGWDAKRSPPASEASRRNDSGDTNSPQTLWRGSLSFSSSNTLAPALAAVRAQAEPAGPAPTTIRSYSAFSKESLPCEIDKSGGLQRWMRLRVAGFS